MKKKIKFINLFLGFSAVALSCIPLANCHSTSDVKIDASKVERSTISWLNDITITKIDVTYSGFVYTNNLYDLNVEAVNIKNFDGFIKTDIIATSDTTFNVNVTFICNGALRLAKPSFDLLFTNLSGSQSTQTITDFSASFTSNLLNISGNLAEDQFVCTTKTQISKILNGYFYAYWGTTYPIKDLSNFYVEFSTYQQKPTQCKIEAKIIEFSQSNGQFGVVLDISNILASEKIDGVITIKNKLDPTWKATAMFFLQISNQIEDGFAFTYDDTSSTATLTDIYLSNETITIPKEITTNGKTYTVNAISFDSEIWLNPDTTVKTLNLPATIETINNIGYKCQCYSNLQTIKIEENDYFTTKDNNVECNCLIDKPSKTVLLGASNPKIPNTTEKIASFAFACRSNVKSFVATESFKSLDVSSFESCEDLESVDLSKTTEITTIPEYCFHFCEKLNNVVLPNDLVTIEQLAFSNCIALENITLPGNLEYIENEAFANCTKIKNFTLPATLTSIGAKAFANCDSLESLTIPKSVTNISSSFNYDCKNLNTLVVEGDNEGGYFSKIDDTPYNCILKQSSEGKIVLIRASDGTNLDVLKKVYKLDNYSFANTSFEEIEIPENITNIGGGAFMNCDSLKSINLSTSPCKIIAADTFSNCSNLTTVKLPTNLTDISYRAFQSCTKLESIDLPNTIDNLWYRAFANCTSLKSIVLPPLVTIVPMNIFENCFSLKNVTLPYYTDHIQKNAFSYCTSLESIEIPEKTFIIDGTAFANCLSLKKASFIKPYTWESSFVGRISEYDMLDEEKAAQYLVSGATLMNLENFHS